MGRVINTNNPGKRRNFHMRTIAEILRRLGQKQAVDDEVKDMTAMIAYCLHEITSTVTESIEAWEKRNYWKKADDFQQKWWWAEQTATQIEKLMLEENWDQLPDIIIKLFPYFSDIEINKMMRSEDLWLGAYGRFISKAQP